ncbi:hypothetical protein BaRGS_00026444 [Batillaria attramentaria]|uniref:Uncharacterized protein n=1 Tax=Batillaria attramentaria TaxID=370345 RepID=A0ABD0K4Q2_9CAEN
MLFYSPSLILPSQTQSTACYLNTSSVKYGDHGNRTVLCGLFLSCMQQMDQKVRARVNWIHPGRRLLLVGDGHCKMLTAAFMTCPENTQYFTPAQRSKTAGLPPRNTYEAGLLNTTGAKKYQSAVAHFHSPRRVNKLHRVL